MAEKLKSAINIRERIYGTTGSIRENAIKVTGIRVRRSPDEVY